MFQCKLLQNLLTKVAQLFGDFVVNFENITLRLVTVVAIFGQLLENLGFFYFNIWSY